MTQVISHGKRCHVSWAHGANKYSKKTKDEYVECQRVSKDVSLDVSKDISNVEGFRWMFRWMGCSISGLLLWAVKTAKIQIFQTN